jgi:hypothetical protein
MEILLTNANDDDDGEDDTEIDFLGNRFCIRNSDPRKQGGEDGAGFPLLVPTYLPTYLFLFRPPFFFF